MRKQVLSLLLGILIITSLMIILMPIASADHDKVHKPEVTIPPLETHEQKIDTSKGEVKYSWEILNYTNDLIYFWILDEDDNDKEIHELGGYISKDINKTKLDSGKYKFRWKNLNTIGSFNLTYNITFPVTGEGCYSTSIILSIPIAGIIFCSIGINKKKK